MSSMLNHEFSKNPTNIEIQRSRFDRNSTHKTTMTEGDLVPIFVDEVLPGDTFVMDTSFLIRMSTPLRPVMDNAYVDIYYFFVPNRLVWDHWQEFCGENTTAPWAQTTEYLVPQLKFDSIFTEVSGYGAEPGTVANYLGVPSYLLGTRLTVSDLPHRAYCLIWNEFFRDENLQYPVPVYTDDSDRSYKNDTYGANNGYAGKPLKVNKYHDYFTSCLPGTQKSIGALPVDAPVFVRTDAYYDLDPNDRISIAPVIPGGIHPLQFSGSSGSWLSKSLHFATPDSTTTPLLNPVLRYNGPNSSYGDPDTSAYVPAYTAGSGSPTSIEIAPDNLWTDLGNLAVSVNALRQAFAVQRLFERDARGGTRYRELLRAHFGVVSPDSRVQVPEYLGGCRVPVNMDQVLQTSSTDSTSPQGNTAAYSMTTSSQSSFTKSFVEHGFVIGLACIRVEHSYSQGVERFLSRKRRFDYYYPALANISEQPVYKKEIFARGLSAIEMPDSDHDDLVFGYQEAWAEYRYKPNRLSGDFSPTSSGQSSLAAAWTYSDYYEDYPTLSAGWIAESSENVGNTLATGTSYPQFICDFYFKLNCTRPMPLYSIPGLIDHH